MDFDWITAKEAAEAWGISDRRVQVLCSNGQIPNVRKFGMGWLIPIVFSYTILFFFVCLLF